MDVLLVDDNDEFRNVTAELLVRAGHTVRTSGNGREALRHLRQAPADLVISDIVMPHQDGLELMMKMRTEFPHIAMIAISGDTPYSGLYLRIAAKLGAVATLLKPFSTDELLGAIVRLQWEQRRKRELESKLPQAGR
jgi:DNA-binding NtrC family response regulator